MSMVSTERKPQEVVRSTRLDPPGSLTVTISKGVRRGPILGLKEEYYELRVVDCTTTRYAAPMCQCTREDHLGFWLNMLEERARSAGARFICHNHSGESEQQIARWRAF